MDKKLSVKRNADIMGMPITVEIKVGSKKMFDEEKINSDIKKVFDYFIAVDKKFSPFKKDSQVSKYNRGEKIDSDMELILKLADELKHKTDGYFNIKRANGKIDPSGIVKGWAINNASDMLRRQGYKKFYIDAGGDAEIVGYKWKWGIRNPFNVMQIVKVLKLSNCGIATSGTYERGQHIYNPVNKNQNISDIVSLTVIGSNVFEADKLATPAFAMGRRGIEFIELQPNFEGYMIDLNGIATMTSGFEKFVA